MLKEQPRLHRVCQGVSGQMTKELIRPRTAPATLGLSKRCFIKVVKLVIFIALSSEGTHLVPAKRRRFLTPSLKQKVLQTECLHQHMIRHNQRRCCNSI